MTRREPAENRAARRRRDAAPAVPADAAPSLYVDFAAGTVALLILGFFARAALNPDGVAYLENAEAIARGRWTDLLQGYWSPAYSLLLAPLVLATGDDRQLLLTLAHVVQAAVGIVALWLALIAARRHVPPAQQRLTFWICAWIILRWVPQELLTPDLALLTCMLGFFLVFDRTEPWLRIASGVLAGTAFLLKTSIWPWLGFAAALAALPALRARRWGALPWKVFAPAALLGGLWIAALSVQAGRPTLGSVGPLNFSWYLGDLSRRTPDTDLGPHQRVQHRELPDGRAVTFADLRTARETYLPWSAPERWSAGVPATARPGFALRQAGSSWVDNGLVLLRWVLPVALGLVVCAWLAGTPGRRTSARRWLAERPLLTTGVVALLVFMGVHAEIRLVAPAVLLATFGTFSSKTSARSSSASRLANAALIFGLAVNLTIYAQPLLERLARNAESERTLHAYLDQQLLRNRRLGAVIVGPATPWMGVLWLHHMRVAVQFGAAGSSALSTMGDAARIAWLRAQFGNDDVLGVGEARLADGGQMRWAFAAW